MRGRRGVTLFVDEAKIKIQAGGGGDGCVAFRREKFVPRGGPSGGDGGRGGHVILDASKQRNTLIHFRYKPEQKAQRGRHGEGSNCSGKSGADLILEVPLGTEVWDDDTGEKLFDFVSHDQKFIAAQGGRGGRGNARFASSTNQAPRRFEPGAPGEQRVLRLELKLLADVGLLGFPNAGKSTLISRISAAHPKIASYPFTTLEPHLGIVLAGDFQSFVIADMPGIIEGAHQGHGLGLRFLRHIERTRMLLHLVDVSESTERDPVEDFRVIQKELESFSQALARKPMAVAATKMDTAPGSERLEHLQSFCAEKDLPFFTISSVSGTGIEELVHFLGARVRELQQSPEAAT